MATPKTKSPARSKNPTATAASSAKTAEPRKVVASQPVTAPDSKTESSSVETVVLRKKDLLEAVVAKSGLSKGNARRGLEATLDVIAEALADGSEISAAPLAKVRVTREKDTPNGKMLVCRVKLRERAQGRGASDGDVEKAGLAKVTE
ncbi:MAG: hypothetical protein HKP40_11380 [Litoreibacter sp.]|nr:hypothetical protein [Litoreibacter sp.]